MDYFTSDTGTGRSENRIIASKSHITRDKSNLSHNAESSRIPKKLKLNEFPSDLRGIIKEATKKEKSKSPFKDFNTINIGNKEALSSSSTISPPPQNRHTLNND